MSQVLFISSDSKGQKLFGMVSVRAEDYASESPEVIAHFADLAEVSKKYNGELLPNEDTLQLYIAEDNTVRVCITSAPMPWLDDHPFVAWMVERVKEKAVENGWAGFVETSNPHIYDEVYGPEDGPGIAQMQYDGPDFLKGIEIEGGTPEAPTRIPLVQPQYDVKENWDRYRASRE